MAVKLSNRVQRHCSKCGGRMQRRTWPGDEDAGGGFDPKTGEAVGPWWWACEHWVPGSRMYDWDHHDRRKVRTPRNAGERVAFLGQWEWDRRRHSLSTGFFEHLARQAAARKEATRPPGPLMRAYEEWTRR